MKLILTQDDFYTCPDLVNQANGTAKPLMMCEVSYEWYLANSGALPEHFEAVNNGDNLVILNTNL